MLFSQCIEEFSRLRKLSRKKTGTIKGYELSLRQFCLYIKDIPVEDVTLDQVEDWFEDMEKLGWKGNSFIPKMMALRKFFEFCQIKGYNVIPLKFLEVPGKELEDLPRVATPEEYAKLLSIIPRNNDPRHIRNLAIITMLWDTGARNSELLSINIDKLNFERKKIIIKTAKNKGSRPFREIFWFDEADINLRAWIEKREHLVKNKGIQLDEENALFIGVTGCKVGHRLTNSGVAEMLRNYSHKAGIPVMNAHSFRHAKGRNIIKMGGSSADVTNVLGHANQQSSKVYTMMGDHDLEERCHKFNMQVGDQVLKKIKDRQKEKEQELSKEMEIIEKEQKEKELENMPEPQARPAIQIPVSACNRALILENSKIPEIMPEVKMPPINEDFKKIIEGMVSSIIKNQGLYSDQSVI